LHSRGRRLVGGRRRDDGQRHGGGPDREHHRRRAGNSPGVPEIDLASLLRGAPGSNHLLFGRSLS
jgi:hypothetical protein